MNSVSIKTFIYSIAAGSTLSFLSWLAILFFSNPYDSGLATHMFFYGSLFLWVMGLVVIATHFIQIKMSSTLFIERFSVSLRIGALVGVLCVSALLLQVQDLLSWWSALLLLLFLSTIETFFQVR